MVNNNFVEKASVNPLGTDLDSVKRLTTPTNLFAAASQTGPRDYVRLVPSITDQYAQPAETKTPAKQISSGASLDEIRKGTQVLVATKHPKEFDSVVEKVQEKIRDLEIRNADGSKIKADGLFGEKTGLAIEKLRDKLQLPFGSQIDKQLIDRLFPKITIENIENGRLQISQKTAGKESAQLVQEVKRLLNQAAPDNKIEDSGKFSTELTKRLTKIQEQNYILPNGAINAATLALVKGETIENLVAAGKATLVPRKGGNLDSNPLVKDLQTNLNTLLGTNINPDGKFGPGSAESLELLQRVAGIRERGVFSKESYQKINELLHDPVKLAQFKEGMKEIALAQEVLTHLPKDKAKSLSFKMEAVSKGANDSEHGMLLELKRLDIDIATPAGIIEFQKSRGIKETGTMSEQTAAHLNEVLSAEWCKERIFEQDINHQWKIGINEINVIGLRGWSPEIGQNDNKYNDWNDTIAIAWKDKQGLLRFREYVATTDPGLLDNSKAPDVNRDGCGDVGHVAPGQYQFKQGKYHDMLGFGLPVKEGEVRVFRDTNHNGKIDEDDGTVPVKQGIITRLIDRVKSYWGDDSFKFHGMRTSSDPKDFASVGGFSAGCQVPKITNAQFQREISPLLYGNPDNSSFPYTLIDMSNNSQFNSATAQKVATGKSAAIASR